MNIEPGYYDLRCVATDDKGEMETRYKTNVWLQNYSSFIEQRQEWTDLLRMYGYKVVKEITYKRSPNQSPYEYWDLN